MVAELISVGTEILMGNIVNTNAQYLSVKLAELGISVYYQVSVGDNEERLFDTIKQAFHRSDLVILTGGLGPTKDDLTKETVAKFLNRKLIMDDETKKRIHSYFKQIGKDNISKNNWKQAEIIENSIVLENNHGTAPGFIVEEGEKAIMLIPGPPNEMKPMFEELILPYLKKRSPHVLYSNMVKVCGIGESMAETMIEDMIANQSNPTIAPYAKSGEVHFRVTAYADTLGEAKTLVKPVVTELISRFAENIYTIEEAETLEEVVINLLKKHELTVTSAESCTAGMFSSRLVNVSGCSDVLKEGFVTYSNEAKSKHLKVSKETLKQYGAVSEQTAREMAMGAAENSGADTAISITGIAGPDGGTPEKPVGTVYVGCYANKKTYVKKLQLQGDRQKVRETTVIYALDFLRRCILEQYEK